MNPFIEIRGLVLNVSAVVYADFRTEGVANIHVASGNVLNFTGDDAAALRRFFGAEAEQPPAQPAPQQPPSSEARPN